MTLVSGRVDDDEVVISGEIFDTFDQGVIERVIVAGLGEVPFADATMRRNAEIVSHMAGPFAPVLDIAGQAPLPGVEVDGSNPMPRLDQGHRDMNRDR